MRLKQRLNGVLTAFKWCLKRHTHPRSKNTTILLVYMGKIKGFLFAVRHREILIIDLGLN